MAISEHQALGVILTGGQAGDAPVGEEMLAEVLVREEIKAVGGDRAYDSNAIRALLKAAGKEAVIPPRSNRRDPPEYDKEKYKERNKMERLFCKLKGVVLFSPLFCLDFEVVGGDEEVNGLGVTLLALGKGISQTHHSAQAGTQRAKPTFDVVGFALGLAATPVGAGRKDNLVRLL